MKHDGPSERVETHAQGDTPTHDQVRLWRLYALRLLYLINFALVGTGVVLAFAHRPAPWDPIPGVAFSFLAALATVSVLGLRHPLAMVPVILLQFLYKTYWLLGVYLPLRSVGRSSDLALLFALVMVVELIVIPWGYLVTQLISKPGDRWRSTNS